MVFLLNVSVEPFFATFFDESKGIVVSSVQIPNTKQSGQVIFDFIESQKKLWSSLDWVGGVSGPGGFATLRIAAGVLNSWSFVQHLPVKQVRADVWVRGWSIENGYTHFVLNSFGELVFLGDTKDLQKVLLAELPTEDNLWYGGLPESKKDLLNNKSIQKKLSIESLYKVLSACESQEQFDPEYMHEAV